MCTHVGAWSPWNGSGSADSNFPSQPACGGLTELWPQPSPTPTTRSSPKSTQGSGFGSRTSSGETSWGAGSARAQPSAASCTCWGWWGISPGVRSLRSPNVCVELKSRKARSGCERQFPAHPRYSPGFTFSIVQLQHIFAADPAGRLLTYKDKMSKEIYFQTHIHEIERNPFLFHVPVFIHQCLN